MHGKLLVQLPPLVGADFDILRQTLAVEPGFAAVYVAHVDEAFVGRIFRAAVAADNENMAFRRHGDGDCVVERGGGSVRPPVHGVDADIRGGDDGDDVLHAKFVEL